MSSGFQLPAANQIMGESHPDRGVERVQLGSLECGGDSRFYLPEYRVQASASVVTQHVFRVERKRVIDVGPCSLPVPAQLHSPQGPASPGLGQVGGKLDSLVSRGQRLLLQP